MTEGLFVRRLAGRSALGASRGCACSTSSTSALSTPICRWPSSPLATRSAARSEAARHVGHARPRADRPVSRRCSANRSGRPLASCCDRAICGTTTAADSICKRPPACGRLPEKRRATCWRSCPASARFAARPTSWRRSPPSENLRRDGTLRRFAARSPTGRSPTERPPQDRARHECRRDQRHDRRDHRRRRFGAGPGSTASIRRWGSIGSNSSASRGPRPISEPAAPGARRRASACGSGPKQTQRALADHEVPEIARVDLSGAVLHLLAWGESDVAGFPWFEPPPPEALAQALTVLTNCGRVTRRD